MTPTEVKPGTRCECRGYHARSANDLTAENHQMRGCMRNAVRMVTVQDGRKSLAAFDYNYVNVPMCSACAQFHEAKAGAR